MISQNTEAVLTKATHVVAVGAIASPSWLPSLSELSNFAATMTPILGAIWLLVQIVRAIAKWGAS